MENKVIKTKHLKKLLLVLFLGIAQAFTAFAQGDVRYNANMNLPFNEKAGDVNPQTGELTLSFTDLYLPGRGGMDFSFGRTRTISQSNVFNMSYINGQNVLDGETVEKENRIGSGWSSTLPYIMDVRDPYGNYSKNLFYGGSVYTIDINSVEINNPGKSNILGYDLTDMRVYKSTAVSYDSDILPKESEIYETSGARSEYVLHLKTNEKSWFDSNGRLIMEEDSTGLNKIWYFYTKDTGRLGQVIDTLNREINFSYDDGGNLSSISWQVNVMKKEAGNSRVPASETREVKYGYEPINSDAYPNVKHLMENGLVQGEVTPYALASVTDPYGNVTGYSYRDGEASFTYNKQKQHSSNAYLLLTGITSNPDGAGQLEKFTSKRCFEYEVPGKGMYRKDFFTGYMEYYRISRQYLLNRHGDEFHNTGYIYYEAGSGNNKNEYHTQVIQGNITKSYIYSLSSAEPYNNHVLDKLRTESVDGFLELTDFVYNNDRTKARDIVFRQGKYAYTDNYYYDNKGNLKRSEDRTGLVSITEYDHFYSVPVRTIQKVTVDGEMVDYVQEAVLNDRGLVEKQKVFVDDKPITVATMEYDEYGNQIAVTDALGNRSVTVYDEVYHAFPVRQYQEYSIKTWYDMTTENFWLDDAEKEIDATANSWSLYNDDGTPWLQIDQSGSVSEYYYNEIGDVIETISPDYDDDRSILELIKEKGSDREIRDIFDVNYFLLRNNNPGTVNHIDYQNDFVKTISSLDHEKGSRLVHGAQSDGIGNIEEQQVYKDDKLYASTRMAYDSLGRMVASTHPDAGGESTSIRINGKEVGRYDKTWLVKYDDVGRKKKVVYPANNQGHTDTKEIEYDDENNIVTTLDSLGRKGEQYFDWSGRLVKVITYGDGKNPEAAREYNRYYDELGRSTLFVDAMGIETAYSYDERGLVREIDYRPLGKEAMEYDDLGRLVRKTDRKHQVSTLSYDGLSRITNSRYYANFDEESANNPNHVVSLNYNESGNIVKTKNNDIIEHYIYDQTLRISRTDRYLTDDTCRNKIAEVWGNVSDSNIYSFGYRYDNAGIMTEMNYPDGSVQTFSYDTQLNNLISIGEGEDEASITPFVTGISYTPEGTISRMDYANNTFQRWEYDNRIRLSNISIGRNNEGMEESILDIGYTLDNLGNVTRITNTRGEKSYSDFYKYDGFNQLVSARSQMPDRADSFQTVLDLFGTFDDGVEVDGQLFNSDGDLNGDSRIDGEDLVLSTVQAESVFDEEGFEYDRNGNRTVRGLNGDSYSYGYGERNQLKKIWKVLKDTGKKVLYTDYEYDGNGNTVRRTVYPAEDEPSEEILFEYDGLNRLVKTVKNGTETKYVYDNAGNRIIKGNTRKTTLYLRHGSLAVAMDVEVEEDLETEELGSINRYVLSGNSIAGRITSSFSIDSETTETEITTKRYWYHLDHLDSTKAVTNEEGEVEVIYEYRAFGEQFKRLDGDGEETGDKAKYSYGGKELDDSDLYYFNARYYDPAAGRFVTVDPAKDGINWYVYVSNNPLRFVDPTGLEKGDKDKSRGRSSRSRDRGRRGRSRSRSYDRGRSPSPRNRSLSPRRDTYRRDSYSYRSRQRMGRAHSRSRSPGPRETSRRMEVEAFDTRRGRSYFGYSGPPGGMVSRSGSVIGNQRSRRIQPLMDHVYRNNRNRSPRAPENCGEAPALSIAKSDGADPRDLIFRAIDSRYGVTPPCSQNCSQWLTPSKSNPGWERMRSWAVDKLTKKESSKKQ